MNRFIYLLLVLGCFNYSKAQEPKFIQHETGNAFKDIPINVMMQDSQCMIWLGTKKGLARYDGITASPLKLDSTNSDIEVTAIFEDKSKIIWIGTSNGDIYYLDLSRNAHVFIPPEGCPEKKITSILQDDKGQVWLATYGEGVYVWTGSRLFNVNADDGLAGNDIYAMTVTSNGNVWLGTDNGINICSIENEKKDICHLGLQDGLPDQIITALESDKNDNVWIGTYEFGAAFYNASLQKITRPFDCKGMDEITAFEIFDEQEIWIGTRSSGVWRFSPQFTFIRKLMTLQPKKQFDVSDILSDIEGNIWIAMRNGSLWSAFRQFESLTTDVGETQALLCDHNDKLWVGTMNGLYRIQDYSSAESEAIRVAPAYDFNISGIVEDDFNNLWIATLDKGLFIYTPSSGKVLEINSSIAKLGSTIMSMARTKNDIWVATTQGSESGVAANPFAGVFSYPTNKDITKEKDFHFQLFRDTLQYVFQVFADSKDRAWIATDGNGVYCIDGKIVRQYKGNNNITLKKVYNVCEDQLGHMWFNTHEWGLVELDGDHYRPLNISEGLASMNNTSIAESKNGDVLVSHDHGIDLMEPKRRHFMYYTSEIGAEDFEPGNNSIATDSSGNVYIGGKNLIMKYYASNHKFSIDPRTQITKVKVNFRPIDFRITNTFRHSQNSFSFDYVGLWYTSPHVVNYEYKLSPYETQFKESKDYTASYSNLRPGKYTFTVKASENRSFFNEPTASYSFTINQPFLFQLWFILIAIPFFGVMIYWLLKSRDKRVQRRALLKKEMIESQLQALKAQINPHFLFNSFNTLITIIDENSLKPQVAIEYVEKLADFFRSILQYREQETVSLEEEWEMVQNFGYLLEKRYGSSLRLHLSKPPKDAFILPMTLQMLVENAVKHNVISENKPLDVYITVDDDRYISVVNNLQPKTKPEPSTQFGLQSIIRRYQLMSERKVIVEKDQNTFKVRIPIINKSN